MQPKSELSIEERVTRLENQIAELTAIFERSEQTEAPAATSFEYFERLIFNFRRSEGIHIAPGNSFGTGNPFAGKSIEWWLARGGAVLTSVALILLYQYAVEHNWLTPLIRITLGVTVGAALMVAGRRLPKRERTPEQSSIGLREVLLGTAVSAWYITAYAAAVYYHFMPLGAARFSFLALTVVAAWLALSEEQSILALLGIAVGFATPLLLPSNNPSIPAFAVFLGALTALGLVVYLMRGWHSIMWLTFFAFWILAASTAASITLNAPTGVARSSMTVLIILAAAAMTRAPVLRRRLLASGSNLYTTPIRSEQTANRLQRFTRSISEITGRPPIDLDSPLIWVISTLSPLLAVAVIASIWNGVPGAVWGIVLLVLALFAYWLASARSGGDAEVRHVEVTAASLLSLAGALWIASSIDNSIIASMSIALIAASAHAFASIYYLRDSEYVTSRRIAFVTAAFSVSTAILADYPINPTTVFRIDRIIAELGAALLAVWIWRSFRSVKPMKLVAVGFGISAFAALMLIDARVFAQIWLPLVTTSYALAGTAMLIIGRRGEDSTAFRRAGAFTLAVVAFRLLVIDLSGVATIWRVLLFLVCGALFLVTSHLLQSPATSSVQEPRPLR
jgi:uncharacterized membrane protein